MVTSPLKLVPGVNTVASISSPSHYLLNDGIALEAGPNIGRNGENLTISFLSMSRVHLSEKLCRSIDEHIPNFAGEVLVIDNGSSRAELDRLSALLATMHFRSRIVELGTNQGVAGGRNRTVEHVNTEWLMCLDNDIYLITNPLARLQRELGVTGSHFINLPLLDPDKTKLFAFGGHLYLNSDETGAVWLGAGSAYQQLETGLLNQQPFLGTFLFGGASILNVDSFKRLGGYDEAMFIGFEDLDFSIRLFRAGMKVACSGLTALVHDHPTAQSNSDADYERTRFCREIVERSAKYLQNKYGFLIWSDAVKDWLESRIQTITGDEPDHGESKAELTSEAPRLPRVALVVDTDNWAYANIAKQIKTSLGYKYNFEILPHTFYENFFQLLAVLEKYDYVHIFWREVLGAFETSYNASYADQLGCNLDELLKRFYAGRPVTSAVYDHLFLSADDIQARIPIFSTITGYTVSSNKLWDIYKNIPDYPQPDLMFPDGVDLDLFKPSNLDRFQRMESRPLVVGWVGNSAWASEQGDPKGVNTILKPAIQELRDEGLNIVSHFADRQDGFIPHSEMPKYYQLIDLYVCTSEIEGTPNPVLEAMASGVPVISTDVGIVPDAFGPLQKQFILQKRSVACLKDAMRTLYRNRQMLASLSQENLVSIRPWDWKTVAARFDAFIEAMMKRHVEQTAKS